MFLKIFKKAELQISRSSLFHSLITISNKRIFEEIISNLKRYYVISISESVYSTTTCYRIK